MFKEYGTQYGAKLVDISLIPAHSTIICAGIGEDISAHLEIQKLKKSKIVGIDSTKKSWNYIENQKDLKDFKLLKRALWHEHKPIIMHENINPQWVSESIFHDHNMASPNKRQVETTTIPELLNLYVNISLLTLDIEGSEYDVIMNLKELSIPQLCIEFHHFCIREKSIEDTQKCMIKLEQLGYKYWLQRRSEEPLKEVTFIHESAI